MNDSKSEQQLLSSYSKSDQSKILAMEGVLKSNNIPSYYYHIGEFAEECVCLEKSSDGWTVYVGERGKKTDEKVFNSVQEACKYVFDKVAESDEQYRQMINEFDAALKSLRAEQLLKVLKGRKRFVAENRIPKPVVLYYNKTHK